MWERYLILGLQEVSVDQLYKTPHVPQHTISIYLKLQGSMTIRSPVTTELEGNEVGIDCLGIVVGSVVADDGFTHVSEKDPVENIVHKNLLFFKDLKSSCETGLY